MAIFVFTLSFTLSVIYVQNDERHLRLLASLRDKTASLSTQLAESRTLCSNYEMQLQQAQVGTQLAVTRQRDLEQELDKCMVSGDSTIKIMVNTHADFARV